MARHLWTFLLLGIFAISFLTNVLFIPKTSLVSLIQLEPLNQPTPMEQNGREVLVAKIYSSYPFNTRNLLTVNAGAKNGVAEGMPVSADGNFLLGGVFEVLENISIVRTIFDKDFSLSVRVGQKEANALLAGGQTPRLTLLEKSADIQSGDLVYSATRGFPYGMKIGEVGQVIVSPPGAFKEAELLLPYQINDLREVAILLK